ncbi:MAG: TolC family protein [Lentisphaerae bacterium]|nr:TolC family protein [Lentisphaerota bacterium]
MLALLLAAGCARFEPTRARQEQTDTFSAHLAERAERELIAPLSLEDCLVIAVSNNYEVRLADLNRQLYRIGKQVAFTAFLPNVAAAAGYNSYAKDPQVTDKRFSSVSLDASMPIFMPSTWFLYMAARHGYATADIAANYVRQGIVLQTTAAYFDLQAQRDTVAALETQLEAARELARRVEGLAEEGMIARWEGDQAIFAAELRETSLNQARRQVTVRRAELLEIMGLSPLAPIDISGEAADPVRPEGAVDELVLQTLEIHPQLAMADRQVVIQDHQVRQAFCNFLPTVNLFSSGSWTGNDLAAHSANWVSGFQGAWTLFDGLANVARYRAAKVERQQSRLERERTFLAVMVGVVAAEAATHDAREAATLAQRAYEVAAAKSADYDAKSGEGLLPLSDALDARADKDLAYVDLVRSRHQERLALANLELAMGLTLTPEPHPPVAEE